MKHQFLKSTVFYFNFPLKRNERFRIISPKLIPMKKEAKKDRIGREWRGTNVVQVQSELDASHQD